jgi:hypothetical protein
MVFVMFLEAGVKCFIKCCQNGAPIRWGLSLTSCHPSAIPFRLLFQVIRLICRF